MRKEIEVDGGGGSSSSSSSSSEPIYKKAFQAIPPF